MNDPQVPLNPTAAAVLDVINVLRQTIEHTNNSDRSLYDLCEVIIARVLVMDGVLTAHAEELKVQHRAISQIMDRMNIMLEMIASLPRTHYKDEVN